MCVLIFTASLSLVTLVSAVHSVEEESEREIRKLLILETLLCHLLSAQICESRDKRGLYLQKGTAGHHRLMPDEFR